MNDAYLQAMGIDVWKSKAPPRVPFTLNIAEMDWGTLEKTVSVCTRCELSKNRTQTVFGSGNKHAKLLFVGEAPGMNEDLQGLPFVGRAGQLLTNMIKAIGLNRDDVFIANVLKCRPPQNRDPTLAEVKCCTPYLIRQIELLQPSLIVALGRISAHFLLNEDASLAKLRGTLHTYQNIPLLVTYHPAYLLRSPPEKKRAWHDWQKISRILAA